MTVRKQSKVLCLSFPCSSLLQLTRTNVAHVTVQYLASSQFCFVEGMVEQPRRETIPNAKERSDLAFERKVQLVVGFVAGGQYKGIDPIELRLVSRVQVVQRRTFSF